MEKCPLVKVNQNFNLDNLKDKTSLGISMQMKMKCIITSPNSYSHITLRLHDILKVLYVNCNALHLFLFVNHFPCSKYKCRAFDIATKAPTTF